MQTLKYKTLQELNGRIKYDLETGCWTWTGDLSDEGYARITLSSRGKTLPEYVHRITHQIFIGPIGPKREVDHLCRNRACVNPCHLEAVTSYENSLRGNHPLFTAHRERKCRKGHDLSIESNVVRRKDGRARCLICRTAYNKSYLSNRKGIRA